MFKRGQRRYAVLIGILPLAAAAVVLVATSNAAPKEKAKSLHGQMVDISNFGGPGCPSALGVCSKFTAKGDIKGDGVVSVDTNPIPTGISKAHTVIHTKKGDLTCSETAVFDLVDDEHPFVDLCLITGGTGIYEGATGWIQEVGTFDFAANLGQLDYYGKLVLAGGHGHDDDD